MRWLGGTVVRLLIAGVFSAALLASGCVGGFHSSREPGERGLPGRGRVPACLTGHLPGPASDASRELPAAGGGRPRTGYVGLAAALYFARDRDSLSEGWGVDLNYVQNITAEFSVEGGVGLVGYDLDAAQKGALRILTFSAAAQYGRPFGTSRWYVGAGAGYWLSVGKVDAEDAPTLTALGGVEFELAARASLDLEFRYTFARSKLSNGDNLDLDAFAARVNYIFVF